MNCCMDIICPCHKVESMYDVEFSKLNRKGSVKSRLGTRPSGDYGPAKKFVTKSRSRVARIFHIPL